MSEYLNRLKQRRDATPPPGNAKNVQSNVSFRKAIDYIEILEAVSDRLIKLPITYQDVFLLTITYPYEGGDVLGVYSTREKANDAKIIEVKNDKSNGYNEIKVEKHGVK